MKLILAISPSDKLLHKFNYGGVKRDIFQFYISELSASIPQTEANIIFDNAKCHLNITTPNPFHRINYLAPYSPMTNLGFNSWKAMLKLSLSSPNFQQRIFYHESAAASGLSMTRWRRNISLDAGSNFFRPYRQIIAKNI